MCRDFAVRNPFEVRAGLADGGYPEPTPKTARRAGDIARPGH
jgi:hypothetical protein